MISKGNPENSAVHVFVQCLPGSNGMELDGEKRGKERDHGEGTGRGIDVGGVLSAGHGNERQWHGRTKGRKENNTRGRISVDVGGVLWRTETVGGIG